MNKQIAKWGNIPMNTSTIANVATTQLGTSCASDSPGLASKRAIDPGV